MFICAHYWRLFTNWRIAVQNAVYTRQPHFKWVNLEDLAILIGLIPVDPRKRLIHNQHIYRSTLAPSGRTWDGYDLGVKFE